MDIQGLGLIGLGTAAVFGIAWRLGGVPDIAQTASNAMSSGASSVTRLVAGDPDKLGWMDDADLADSDKARIAEISGAGQSSNIAVIRSMQAGVLGATTRRDFELLRQDRRRAQAAYPDVSSDDLYTGTWLSVDVSARVPDSFCTSGNSDGQIIDGKSYLDGGCYVSTVKPEYTKRADAATTKRVLAELKDADRQKTIKQISKWGYSYSLGGGGGGKPSSLSVNCYPDPLPSDQEEDDLHIPGKCVVVVDGTMKHAFPYLPSEWVNPPWSIDEIKKLASFAQATTEPYKAVEKPWVRKDGALAHGETCPTGRLCWSKWNGDGYDNNDIGPSDPASWVIDGVFGSIYMPARDNGEQHSAPGKPWYLVISYYGFPPQVSGGWTETEAKDALPKFLTGMTYPMDGRDFAEANRGNLQEARATQTPPAQGALILADRALPIAPPQSPQPSACMQGGTLMPGQSCTVGGNWQ